jgi:undecaprenyl-diphosphatase
MVRAPESTRVLVNHRRALRLVAVLLALAGVVLVLVGWSTTKPAVQAVDDAVLRGMVAIRVAPLTWVAEALSRIGGVWVNWPLRVIAVVALLVKRRWLQAAAFVLAVATSELLIGVLKTAYDRPRPLHSLVATSGASFPSGHSVAGAVTAVGLVLVLLPPGRERWKWELRAAIFATVMSLSSPWTSAEPRCGRRSLTPTVVFSIASRHRRQSRHLDPMGSWISSPTSCGHTASWAGSSACPAECTMEWAGWSTRRTCLRPGSRS